MTVTTAQITILLENILFETQPLVAGNVEQWMVLSTSNPADSTVIGLAEAMAGSAEIGIAEQVVRYYQGGLGRQPSATEIGFYVEYAETSLSASQIAQGAGGVPVSIWSQIAGYFAASPEFQAQISAAGGNVIQSLYLNVLDRTPSAAEVSFYQKVLDGGTPVSTLLQYFVNSPEYQAKANGAIADRLAFEGEVAAGAATPTAIPVPPTELVGVSAVHNHQNLAHS